MFSYEYEPLRTRRLEEPSITGLDPGVDSNRRSYLPKRTCSLAMIGLLISVSFNVLWTYHWFSARDSPFVTKYAKLTRDLPVPFVLQAVYTDESRDIADEAWSAPTLEPATGLVALPDELSQSMGLPPAQRWPWDKSKGIYLLNAYHNLHCLHVIRATALEFYDGKPASKTLGHVVHCLNVLREEIVCNADDTPRYTGPLNAEVGKKDPKSGIGQIKMCNSWAKLEEFAIDNSACFKPINKSTPGFPTKERYKFCPDGSVLWP